MLILFNLIERNHWQLMADLSNNDYDIDYFGGRVAINDEFNDFLCHHVGEFDIIHAIDCLNDILIECASDQKENNKESYQGNIDECGFLLQFVHQNYLLFNTEDEEDGQGDKGEIE